MRVNEGRQKYRVFFFFVFHASSPGKFRELCFSKTREYVKKCENTWLRKQDAPCSSWGAALDRDCEADKPPGKEQLLQNALWHWS